MKKINSGEDFEFSGWIFQLSMNEGKVKLTPIRESSSKKVKKEFKAPSLLEVKEFFRSKGYSEEGAQKAWEHYEYGDPPWTDSRGTPVRAWRQKMNTNWLRPEFKIKEKSQVEFFQEEI